MWLLLLSVCHGRAQATKVASKAPDRLPSVIHIETAIKPWTDGYAKWVVARPQVVLARESSSGVQINLRMPYLDYFGSDGSPHFLGMSAPSNIQFLNKLPLSAQETGNKSIPLEPTLAEYLDIIPNLTPYKARVLAQKLPVVLAICKYESESCKLQNEALHNFSARAASLKIQVIEVKLLQNPPGQ